MKLNEINKPSAKAIFESLQSDKDHTFNSDTLQEIAESVSKFDNSQTGMTVEEAIQWLDSL